MSVNENQCIVLSKNYIIMYAKLFTCVENDLISQYKLHQKMGNKFSNSHWPTLSQSE